MRTVALLARGPGLLVLRDALARHPKLSLAAVFTHGRLPQAEGSSERPEVARYRELCSALQVPLTVADHPEARDIGPLLPQGPLDLLVALSWRFLVPETVLHRFALGGINLHRGALPAYAGAIPVERAIEAGESKVAITAHAMSAAIDGGDKIAEVWHRITPLPPGTRAVDHAESVKSAIEPLYAPLLRLAIDARLGEARGA